MHQGNGKKFSELTMLDESQLRRTMFDKSEFKKLLSKTKERLDSESNPRGLVPQTDYFHDDEKMGIFQKSA